MDKKFIPRSLVPAFIEAHYGVKFVTAKTLAKLACQGGGPPITRFGTRVFHEADGVHTWVQSRLHS